MYIYNIKKNIGIEITADITYEIPIPLHIAINNVNETSVRMT